MSFIRSSVPSAMPSPASVASAPSRVIATVLCVALLALVAGCGDKLPHEAQRDAAEDGDAPDVALDVADTTLDVAGDDGELDDGTEDAVELDQGTDGAVGLDTGWDAGPRPLEELEDLRDDALRSALAARVTTSHTGLGYDEARALMYEPTRGVDVRDGVVECVYTGELVHADGSLTPGGVINTEHSWPQSMGASEEPARSDLHHLFPVTGNANSARGNTPYGDTRCSDTSSCSWAVGGSEMGTRTGGTERVFEVRTRRRGDIARAQFYFSVRYRLPIPGTVEATLRQWNADDPPDSRERVRNDVIEQLQGNRNPFVDRSDFVWLIGDF